MIVDTAAEDELIDLAEGELEKLMHQTLLTGEHIDLSFGPGWCALNWRKGQKMPAAVRLLGLMRGVLNENCDGAGI